MHVTFIHDARIPPIAYGGTERIIDWLARALIRRQHTVSIIARKGSHVPGAQCIAINERAGEIDSLVPASTDILHLWGTPNPLPKKPFIVTIEGNGQPGEIFHPNTVFISKKHAENHSSQTYVYNGTDLTAYRSETIRKPYLAFLAKASWSVKNLEGAIAVARKIGLPLKVMGSRNYPLGIQKLSALFSKDAHYLGMLGDREKIEVLSQAQALLFPVRWHEPFGIALTEALACGCPILGTPYGSLPEIVSADVGFLSNNGDALAAWFKNNQASFDREACIKRAREHFSADQMADRYLKLYAQILETGNLGSREAPHTRDGFRANDLLPWT